MKGTKIFLKNEKDKKDQYGCEWYKNLSQEEKQKERQYGRERYRVLKTNVIWVSR